ncbi:acyltransferase family protein [Mycobacterium sp. TY814]|uniref:acyltransferase family protein n=1 Tax=unclassified Mycobacterium TaxID=2642494 RepID=UPI0027420382|nr:acyltransferase family protein [Mycobacterium sp. TY814]MDP7720894.1 acyltransferase family protein [Mycobacterium sp. TY814]
MTGSRRSDIQGLRAVAVLLVACFHGGLPVPGGFVGVDVFFVISGFVITGMIYRERSASGGFRLRHFYFRRFKRLTPALALTVAVTIVLSFCLMSPFEVQQKAAQAGAAAMLLVANFEIARNTGDYFAQPAKVNPMLHTWSLSVEEQFYLVFPALLLLSWALSKHGPRRPGRAIVLVSIVSAVSFWLAVVHPGGQKAAQMNITGFYSPFTRAWEFAVGALLALFLTTRSLRSDKFAEVLAWLGIALIVLSAAEIDEATPFPSTWTLLPVVATLLLIAAGTHHVTTVGRVLTLAPIVKLGDWSYSIYLWHWPLDVFAIQLWPGSSYATLISSSLAIPIAAASYHWVEQPIQRLPPLNRARSAALIAAVVLPPVLLAEIGVFAANDFWIPRYRSGVVPTAHHGSTDWDDFYHFLNRVSVPCFDQPSRDSAVQWKGLSHCRQSKTGSKVDIAIIGDSHAEHLFLGLAEALPDKNILYYMANGLPVATTNGMADVIAHFAADPILETVVINGDWPSRGVGEKDQLATTLNAFASKGKSVFVTDDVPWFRFDAVVCKYRIAPILPFSKCTQSRQRFEDDYATYFPALRSTVNKVPGATLLETAQYFCDRYSCRMNQGDALLFRDSNHLNETGSRYLAGRMLADNPQFRAAVSRSSN